MRTEGKLLRISFFLMRAALRIAPASVQDWGRAMIAELDHVEGSWAALLWAVGGASVLARTALLSLFSPTPARTGPGGAGMARTTGMRRAASATAAICVAGALLLFLLPTFRDGLEAALSPWSVLFSQPSDQNLLDLAERAEKEHDADTLEFVAMAVSDQEESVRLVDEAVALNPNLTWAYAVVASQHSNYGPEVDRWVKRLEQWDPGNAFPYLLLAESTEIRRFLGPKLAGEEESSITTWNREMEAAFQAAKFDDYVNRQVELNRRVLRRHRYSDSAVFLPLSGLPTYGFWDIQRYTRTLIARGLAFEHAGDPQRAAEVYREAAHFGRLIASQGGNDQEFLIGTRIQLQAHQRLRSLLEPDGKGNETVLIGTLLQQLQRHKRYAKEQRALLDFYLENTFLVQASGLLVFFFAMLLLVWGVGAITWRAAPIHWTISAAGSACAVGLLVSAVILYLTYQPYAEARRRFLLNSDTVPQFSMLLFRGFARSPLGMDWIQMLRVNVYFWSGVTMLGFTVLMVIGMRSFMMRRRLKTAA